MRIELSLSKDYVSHWGLWEALRELYQNAMDEDKWEIFYANETLHIVTLGKVLDRSSLLLGSSSKVGFTDKRGQYGEGYKLALLSLCRLGHTVSIRTGGDVWSPNLETSKTFGSEVLVITIEPDSVETNGVDIRIQGITEEEFLFCQKNICEEFGVLKEPSQVGRIYVGNLYVCTMPKFKRGYSFKVGQIQLDRDRQMVKQFDLSYATSKIWAEEESDESALELMDEGAPDVEYIMHHAHSEAPATRLLDRHFPIGVVPVSNDEEIQEAIAAGMKFKLVTHVVKAMLAKVRNIRIPMGHKTPIQRLEILQRKLDGDLAEELADIIKALKGEVE